MSNHTVYIRKENEEWWSKSTRAKWINDEIAKRRGIFVEPKPDVEEDYVARRLRELENE